MDISLDHSRKGTKKPPSSVRAVFFVRSVASVSLFPLRRISTPHKIILFEAFRRLKYEYLSFSTVTCANPCISTKPVNYGEFSKKEGSFNYEIV